MMSSIFLSNLSAFFSDLGSGFLDLLKRLFSSLLDALLQLFGIIRHNPQVHKVIKITCFASFVCGALFLVFFAVISPELPPGNLVSTIKDVTVNHRTGEYSRSQVVLSSSEDDWVELTSFDNAELETGAGSQAQDRSIDFEYPIRPGETLSEIAYSYGIPYDFLAWYNKINNANRIRVGTVITIPSLENISALEPQYKQQKAKQKQAPTTTKAAKNIAIAFESRNNGHSNGSGITVQFSIVNPPADLKSYEWELGDGKRSFRENPSYEYSDPKTYVIRLTAKDSAGVIYRSNHLYIDIPHPASAVEHSTTKFVTLSSPDDYFVVNGTIAKVAKYANIDNVLDLSESDHILTKVRFKKSGYYGVTVREESGREQYYSIFVSPIPTMHVDLPINSFNWYRTQFNTGTPSNCGPASASMAISWAGGKYFPVSAVRQAIGWHGNGGTSFDELLKVILNQGVDASIEPLKTTQNMQDVIDSGGIAIILFHTDGVRSSRGNPATDLFGKYYNDSVGHYVVVKGYSLNGEYFVIHDPIPSDWSANSFRYEDEISMMGKNRYFSASEVLRSLRRGEMIVVHGKN
jgi:murein DD-endopeptidase MepM/ murein hydrolase activator NlpD